MANTILINDFDLFIDAMKTTAKLVDAAKLIFSPAGLEVYGARSTAARVELTTNAVTSDSAFDFCIDKLSNLNRVLATAKEIHAGDFSGLKIEYTKPNLMLKSKKFKMKYSTCNEAAISKWVSSKIEAKMDSVFEFKTSSDLIKRANGHTFLFSSSDLVKVYLETRDDMEANTVFATLGDKRADIGKEITMKLGLVTFGSIPAGKSLVIDIERLNLFNCMQSDNIEICLMDVGCLLSKTKVTGKNGSFFNAKVYSTILKG